MNSRLPRLRKPVVVVEIGAEWLKVLQAEPARGGMSLRLLHVEKAAPSSSGQAEALAAAFRNLRLPSAPVIACLPRQMVTIRMLDLPSTHAGEIADMVDLQIGKLTPYSKDEVASDYRVVGGGQQGYTRVMLTIVQRSVLRQQFSIYEQAGLEVDRMSVSSEGILNWLRAQPAPGAGPVGLLDVDASYSDFLVVSGDSALFSRGILMGAGQLLGDLEKAGERYSRELMRALEAYQADAGAPVARLVLTGAGPRVQGLARFLAEQTKLEVQATESLQVAGKRGRGAEGAEFRTVSLTPLVGIACSPDALEISLVPESVRMRRDLVRKARGMTAFAMLLMTAMVLISLSGMARLGVRQQRYAELRRTLESTARDAATVQAEREIVKLARRRGDLSLSSYNLVHDLYRRTEDVPGIKFESVEIDTVRRQVLLAGTSSDNAEIRTLSRNLEQSPLLKNVKEPATVLERGGNRYRFRLTCSMEGPE